MSSRPQKILVTGATGIQAGGVVRHCLRAGHAVTALVRNPDAAAAKAVADLGATLARGSYDDTEALDEAARGMDAVFFTPPGDISKDLEYGRNVVTAAWRAHVPLMIVSTAARTGDHESFPGWGPDYPMYEYWLTKDALEQLVRRAGFSNWVILRPSHFLQNFTPPVSQFLFPGLVERRVIKSAFAPDAKLGWIDATDVGVVVAALMTDSTPYTTRALELAVESLTIGEVAEKLSAAAFNGEPVTVEPYSDAERKALEGGPILGSQRWASEVATDAGVETTAKEFAFTPVHEFFAKTPLV